MNLLISLLILVIIIGLTYWLITMLPLPAPMMQIAQVILVLIALVVLLGMVFGAVPVFHLRL